MVATPYLLLAGFGFLAYRGYRKLRQMDARYEADEALDRTAEKPE